MGMNIALLPGDDIGPEISSTTRRVLEALDKESGLDLTFDEREVGMASYRSNGVTITEDTVQAAINADGVILGPAGMSAYPPVAEGGINIPGTIRKRLDLFANLRPSRARASIPHAREGLDVMLVRENTEGFYADRSLYQGYGEFQPTEDTAMSLRLITRKASQRIARVAFEQARARNSNVTVIGKRHVLQVTDGLFMAAVAEVGEEFPDILVKEMDVDAMAADLYLRPERFNVLLTTNMYGDILSNEAAAFAGGLGLAGALNVGDHHAAANAGHGSAPDIAGQGIANPTSLIISSALLLDWWGRKANAAHFTRAARALEVAVDTALASDTRTGDLGGSASTTEFADVVIRAISPALEQVG